MRTLHANHTEDPRITVLRSLTADLIVSEINSAQRRAAVERAVRDYARAGVSIEALSDAAGLPPDQIKAIVESVPELDLDDLEVMAGSR